MGRFTIINPPLVWEQKIWRHQLMHGHPSKANKQHCWLKLILKPAGVIVSDIATVLCNCTLCIVNCINNWAEVSSDFIPLPLNRIWQSTVCKKIVELLDQHNVDKLDQRVDIISQESFYRELDDKERVLAAKGCFDFDHPSEKFSATAIESTLYSANTCLESKTFLSPSVLCCTCYVY